MVLQRRFQQPGKLLNHGRGLKNKPSGKETSIKRNLPPIRVKISEETTGTNRRLGPSISWHGGAAVPPVGSCANLRFTELTERVTGPLPSRCKPALRPLPSRESRQQCKFASGLPQSKLLRLAPLGAQELVHRINMKMRALRY